MKDLFKILFIKIDGVMVFLFIINVINFEKILIINGVMKNGKLIVYIFFYVIMISIYKSWNLM